MLGESAFISGDVQYSLAMQNTLLEDARRRRSPLHLCWGLLGVAVNHMRLSKFDEVVPMLEEALQILEETPNLASSIETNGQMALAHFRLGDEEKALVCAQKVFDLAGNISPTVYSTNIGFTAIADIYFEMWERALQDPTRQADVDKWKQLAAKSLKLVRGFEKVFPIGRPSTPYYQGWYEWLTGKPEAAIKSWNKGLEAAQKYNMPYEEGLLRLKLGTHRNDGAASRLQHLERAAQIFDKMGAVRECTLVQQAMQK
jgi:tetratricopeptide (TPR) repeat protein